VTYVTEQRVIEQKSYGCAFCVNDRIVDQDKIQLPPLLMRAVNFIFFWEKVELVVHGMHGGNVIWLCGMG